MQVPRVASSARPAGLPSGAKDRILPTTAQVLRVERVRAVTAAASYVFVAAAIACTFLV
ncbi:MAG: hypothetical protein AAGI22_21645 [Planctomycetota bacterium]